MDDVCAPSPQDDFDIGEEELLQEVDVKDREENQEKLRRRVASVNVKVMNPPRPGKKLLVRRMATIVTLMKIHGAALSSSAM